MKSKAKSYFSQSPKWPGTLVLAGVFLSALVQGCHPKTKTETTAAKTKEIVAVARVKRADVENELTFQAELRPKYAVELHAKVAGFVRSLAVDIGDRVTEGQVLAELEIPLLDEDINRAAASLHRSEEEVRRAKAGYNETHLTLNRLQSVLKTQPHLIAQQDLDIATEKDNTASANLAGRATSSGHSSGAQSVPRTKERLQISRPVLGRRDSAQCESGRPSPRRSFAKRPGPSARSSRPDRSPETQLSRLGNLRFSDSHRRFG